MSTQTEAPPIAAKSKGDILSEKMRASRPVEPAAQKEDIAQRIAELEKLREDLRYVAEKGREA